MLLKPTALLFIASGAHALASRHDECAFTLNTGGSVSAPVGQYGSGQTRAGLSETPSNFLLKGDTIVDAQGRGCWWTPPALVLQCDVGQIPEAGFGIDCGGALSYNGQTTFHQCDTGAGGLVMIYREPNGSNCGEISLKADGCGSRGNCSSSAPPDTYTTVPGNSSLTATATATATGTPIWSNSTISIPGNTTAASTGSETLYSTGSDTVPSTSCETTQPVTDSYPATAPTAPTAPTDSQNSSCASCDTGYATATQSISTSTSTPPSSSSSSSSTDCAGQNATAPTGPADSGWNSTTTTTTTSQPGTGPGPSNLPPTTLETQTYPAGESETGGPGSGYQTVETEQSATEQCPTEQCPTEQPTTETEQLATYPGAPGAEPTATAYGTGGQPPAGATVTSTVPCSSTAESAV